MERIGGAFPGDPTRAEPWSGIPLGVLRGLLEAGVEPVPVRAAPAPAVRKMAVGLSSVRHLGTTIGSGPEPLRRAHAAALASPELAAVHSWVAPRALRRAGRLDGVIQIGTGYDLPADAPIVTFEDMTVAQTATHPYAGWKEISPRGIASRMARQRRAYERAVACCVSTPWAARSIIDDYGVPP